MDELKPCPYCGGEAKLLRRKLRTGFYTRGGTWYVHCKACLNRTEPRKKRETVIELWNRRSQ